MKILTNLKKRKIYREIYNLEKNKSFVDLENLYKQLSKLDNLSDEDWFNIGLFYKFNKNWKESIEANLKAIELNPKNEGANWNLGIAYTALSDFNNSMKYWKFFDVEIESITGFSKTPLGLIPIRLFNGDVVWCERLDPARTKIITTPLPDSEHNYNDILLNDGVPDGYRKINGKEIPVFNEIECLVKSKYKTYSLKIFSEKDLIVEYINTIKDKHVENWTDSLRFICNACSKGIHDYTSHTKLEKEDYLWLGIAVQNKSELDNIINKICRNTGLDKGLIVIDK